MDGFPKVFLTWNWRSCMFLLVGVILRNFGRLLSVSLSWWFVQISGHDCRAAGRRNRSTKVDLSSAAAASKMELCCSVLSAALMIEWYWGEHLNSTIEENFQIESG